MKNTNPITSIKQLEIGKKKKKTLQPILIQFQRYQNLDFFLNAKQNSKQNPKIRFIAKSIRN